MKLCRQVRCTSYVFTVKHHLLHPEFAARSHVPSLRTAIFTYYGGQPVQVRNQLKTVVFHQKN